jgi:hypothetical protein
LCAGSAPPTDWGSFRTDRKTQLFHSDQ